MMSELKDIPIEKLTPNPFRLLSTYPWIEKKLQALEQSIATTGLWESVIARKHNGEYQLAFGHHRIEAARRLGMKKVRIIVKDLTDMEMIQYMGRENGEDYATDFLVMLNTWEGAILYLSNQGVANENDSQHPVTFMDQGVTNFAGGRPQKIQDVVIAGLLGWSYHNSSNDKDRLTDIARACSNAHDLITAGHLTRESFTDLSVRAVRDLTGRTVKLLKDIETAAIVHKQDVREVNQNINMLVKGTNATIKQVKEGQVLSRDVANQVNINTHKAASIFKDKKIPLFSEFGKSLANSLDKLLSTDVLSERLKEMASVINNVSADEDIKAIENINYRLSEVIERATKWRKRLTHVKGKTVEGDNHG